MWGGNFAPRQFAYCDGQLLPISSNTALFSLLGTIYGGDGRTTFALPDLRGRVPMHQGNGPGLSTRPLGQKGGQETIVLNLLEIPSHNHQTTGTVSGTVVAENDTADAPGPRGKYFANSSPNNTYKQSNTNPQNMATGSVSVDLSGGSTTLTGGSQPHYNMQPYLVVSFIIALQGIFPSRN